MCDNKRTELLILFQQQQQLLLEFYLSFLAQLAAFKVFHSFSLSKVDESF
jgi:hypothetical protein